MPGKMRSTPVRTSRATRSTTMSARRCQIRACSGSLAKPAPKASVCSGPGRGPGLCELSRASSTAEPLPRGSEPEPAGVSGGFWPCGSGPCFVADTTNRQYNFRGFRITFNLGPQSLDMDIDQPGVSRVAVTPDLLQEQFAGEDLPGLARQGNQEIELQGGQRNPLVATAHQVAGDVDGDVGDAQCLGRLLVARAQARAHTGNELGRLEGFGHVIVGARLQPPDHIGSVRLGGKHDDRYIRLRADLPALLDAVRSRQHQVEEHKIRLDERKTSRACPPSA